jgi:hypothetical protein
VGAKLVIDTDDDFHNIDLTHPEYLRHKSTLEAFDYLVGAADQIWASTPQLAASFSARNQHAFLVPNTLDQRLWPRKGMGLVTDDSAPIRMLYMGTVSHSADFDIIFPALDAVASKYPGSFVLTVIGVTDTLPDRPWIRRIYQKRGGSLYPRFVPWLIEQGPFDIGLLPLVDSSFNRGKSDIKCLDYIGTGCVPVVSDVEAYGTKDLSPAIIKVKGSGPEWEETLANIVQSRPSSRKELAERLRAGKDYLDAKRSAGATAKRLLELLSAL